MGIHLYPVGMVRHNSPGHQVKSWFGHLPCLAMMLSKCPGPCDVSSGMDWPKDHYVKQGFADMLPNHIFIGAWNRNYVPQLPQRGKNEKG